MNDKVLYNLENEISKYYNQMNYQNESNFKLENEQKEMIKDIQIMLDIVDKEQMNFQDKYFHKKNNSHNNNESDYNSKSKFKKTFRPK